MRFLLTILRVDDIRYRTSIKFTQYKQQHAIKSTYYGYLTSYKHLRLGLAI